jgi:hypothetical protein
MESEEKIEVLPNNPGSDGSNGSGRRDTPEGLAAYFEARFAKFVKDDAE